MMEEEWFYDVLVEILSACPLEVVDKSKLVSKYFNQLCFDPAFIQSHKKKTGTIYGYILHSTLDPCNVDFKFVSNESDDNTTSTLNLDFLPSNLMNLASSDQGLLCYTARMQDNNVPLPHNKHGRMKYFVCMPTTSQIEMLPYPLDIRTMIMALAVLQSDPLRYKILGFSVLHNR